MPDRRSRIAALLVVLGVIASAALSQPAVADTKTARYIVSTRSTADTTRTLSRTGVRARHRYSRVLNGFAAPLTSTQVAALRADPQVISVEPDHVLHATETQTAPTWGLDRLDQHSATRNNSYSYLTTGAGVTAYVIDTGIRFSHDEFGGRAESGYDFVDYDDDANDCDGQGEGHGTHVSGTLGGATWGVAKKVSLVSLRVLDCTGSGYESDFIAALQYVIDNKPSGPAVVNISAGGDPSTQLDKAVASVVAEGVPVVVAAGNENTSACNSSPARAPSAITVAASTKPTSNNPEVRASFSNYGSCVDIFAPGSGVKSAFNSDDDATAVFSGTSMATPHVAGAIARYLQAYPKASPATAAAAMIAESTKDAIGNAKGSPNRFLYLRRDTTYSPRSLSTAVTSSSATLSWKAPYGFGSPAVTGYKLSRNGTNAAGKAFTPVTVSASTLSYAFTGLRSKTAYTLSIQAVNSAGASVVASASVTTK